MRTNFIVLFFFLGLSSFAQNLTQFDSLTAVFGEERFLFEKHHKYRDKGGLIQGMLNEIEGYQGDSLQQYATIAFYDQAYGFKWVNNTDLTYVIDSIISNSSSVRIKELAIQIKTNKENGLIGQQVPEIKLMAADGVFVDLASINSKYIIIDLWATWCAPCLKDMQKIPDLKEKYGFVEFYSISFDKDFEKMAKFVTKKNYDWPIVFAGENHALWDYFNIRALPQYFILDENHKIIHSMTGGLEDKLKEL